MGNTYTHPICKPYFDPEDHRGFYDLNDLNGQYNVIKILPAGPYSEVTITGGNITKTADGKRNKEKGGVEFTVKIPMTKDDANLMLEVEWEQKGKAERPHQDETPEWLGKGLLPKIVAKHERKTRLPRLFR